MPAAGLEQVQTTRGPLVSSSDPTLATNASQCARQHDVHCKRGVVGAGERCARHFLKLARFCAAGRPYSTPRPSHCADCCRTIQQFQSKLEISLRVPVQLLAPLTGRLTSPCVGERRWKPADKEGNASAHGITG